MASRRWLLYSNILEYWPRNVLGLRWQRHTIVKALNGHTFQCFLFGLTNKLREDRIIYYISQIFSCITSATTWSDHLSRWTQNAPFQVQGEKRFWMSPLSGNLSELRLGWRAQDSWQWWSRWSRCSSRGWRGVELCGTDPGWRRACTTPLLL